MKSIVCFCFVHLTKILTPTDDVSDYFVLIAWLQHWLILIKMIPLNREGVNGKVSLLSLSVVASLSILACLLRSYTCSSKQGCARLMGRESNLIRLRIK